MSLHTANTTYLRSFDIVERRSGDRYDVITTKADGSQSTYTGLTLDEVVDYYRAWSIGEHWVRPIGEHWVRP